MFFYFIPVVLALLLYLVPDKFEKLKEMFFLFVLVVTILFVGFRGPVDRDFYSYFNGYYHAYDVPIFEPTIRLISFIANKVFNTPVFIILTYAILGILVKVTAIRKLSKYFYLSLIWYLCTFFNLHEFTQIRIGVGSGIFLMMVYYRAQNKNLMVLFLLILGAAFHFSMLATAAIFFLSPKRRLSPVLSISGLLFAIFISSYVFVIIASIPIFGDMARITAYTQNDSVESVSILNPIMLLRLILFFILLFKQDVIKEKLDDKFYLYIKIYFISFLAYYVFLKNAAFALRFKELFGVIEIAIIPYVVYVFKEKHAAISVLILCALGLFAAYLFYVKLFVPYYPIFLDDYF